MSGAVGIAVALIYLVSAILFVFGLKRLARVRTARQGNGIAAFAMLLAIVGTLVELGWVDYRWILAGLVAGSAIGAVIAVRVPMTAMPEMVAILNGFGGAASALVAISIYWVDIVEPSRAGTAASLMGGAEALTAFLSILIGGVTFSGSVVAYAKLNGSLPGRPILLPGRHALNLVLLAASVALGLAFSYTVGDPAEGAVAAWGLLGASLALGVLLVIPIGGADMPVVVSLLNSYSGLAACATGFVIGNNLLIISGAMVGAAGIILTRIMCEAMNRSLVSVVLGGFGGGDSATAEGAASGEYSNTRSAGAEEAAMVLEAARKVVVVPGYGLAVAQAQHAVRELGELLEKRGAAVTYAIHPVAGRMPGHMNVLLAEADIPYEKLWEMDRINPELRDTDVAIVLGANDVVNPAALVKKDSPIFGMPILEVHHARTVFVVKRSLGAGYAGIKNELFEQPNTMMIFGDAKKVLQELIGELKQL
ncbi:NAD(P)(+) transhydrogenase (Re/Si-specific) subunit beta [Vulgatibacter incomptus]|uniref:NAD(P) transhydrogenase subunit beta n=1 Tax=Vulgatibacter incomptus TaxID=1391653 RepID=A0A0K1PFI8_9BACT|nr:NAD(P)(+) transhydrogenase (Re/Si-specific) subunit beta [Vulgatibacter incomptus]AKU91879.1 NAD(P) transhydrogenase subunit beta [Vulgatibacter incomptus]